MKTLCEMDGWNYECSPQPIHQQAEATSNRALSLANGIIVLNMKQKIREKNNNTRLWEEHNSARALKLLLCPCHCQKLLSKKKEIQFAKDTLIMGARDKASWSRYGIFSNTITHPLTKIFRLDNGAMKICSTIHNCSFWNIDELNWGGGWDQIHKSNYSTFASACLNSQGLFRSCFKIAGGLK